jgi:glucose/mannose-6-phosphate isomerase
VTAVGEAWAGRRQAEILLDDPGRVARVDAEGMLGHVAALGDQMREGYRIGRSFDDPPSGRGVRSIVVCGMGGSGLVGDVLRGLYASVSPVPIVVCKDYELPEFCGRDTVVLAASFSGNTEETLAAYATAVRRGCRLVTFSAGGELAARSAEDGVAHVAIPAGVPVPRAALGLLSAAPIGMLDAMGLIPPAADSVREAAEAVDALARDMGPDRSFDTNPAKAIAAWIGSRTPLLWGASGLGEAAALRWKNQFNENAKVPAFVATLPELDHNDIEGWAPGTGSGYALVILRPGGEAPAVTRRVPATLEAIASSGLEHQVVVARGATRLERLFRLIATGDFVSCYVAVLLGVDPTPIPVLTRLKEMLRE